MSSDRANDHHEDTENSLTKILATALGVVQGLGWSVMCIICIVSYYTAEISIKASTYMEAVQLWMYRLFLYHNDAIFTNQTLTGDIFHAFMWIYLLLDLIWIGLSIYLWRASSSKAAKAWSYWTFLISLFDVITVIILGADYSKCMDFAEGKILVQAICANGILPVFFIAAKGFTLLIFNISLAFVLNKNRKALQTNVQKCMPKVPKCTYRSS